LISFLSDQLSQLVSRLASCLGLKDSRQAWDDRRAKLKKIVLSFLRISPEKSSWTLRDVAGLLWGDVAEVVRCGVQKRLECTAATH